MMPGGRRYGFSIGNGYPGEKLTEIVEKFGREIKKNMKSCTNVVEKNRQDAATIAFYTIFQDESI